MKQLLFKVWDFEQNCWIENSTGFDWWFIDEDGDMALRQRLNHAVPYTPGRFDILLWTGQKDREGKDVYDGHLVEPAFAPGIWCVIFSRGSWVLTKMNHSKTKMIEGLPGLGGMAYSKIIGHKHENPKLLKEIE